MANANICPTGRLIELTLSRLRNCVFSAAVSLLALTKSLAVPYYLSIVVIAEQLRDDFLFFFFFLNYLSRTKDPASAASRNFSKQSRNKWKKRRRTRRRGGNCASAIFDSIGQDDVNRMNEDSRVERTLWRCSALDSSCSFFKHTLAFVLSFRIKSSKPCLFDSSDH